MSAKSIRDNLDKAIEILSPIPEEAVSLHGFSDSCKTIACSLGWLAMSEKFEGLTLIPREGSEPTLWLPAYNGIRFSAGWEDFEEALDGLFGKHCYKRLFELRNEGAYDNLWFYRGAVSTKISDKALALLRLRTARGEAS